MSSNCSGDDCLKIVPQIPYIFRFLSDGDKLPSRVELRRTLSVNLSIDIGVEIGDNLMGVGQESDLKFPICSWGTLTPR